MQEEQSTSNNKAKADLKKLRKSGTDKYILGVCGGIAEYFGIDVTIVRVLWVISIFMGGFGFVAYVVAALLMPKAEDEVEESAKEKEDKTGSLRYVIGGILLILGILFVFKQFRYIDVARHGWDIFRYAHFPWDLIWPLALIALAIYVVIKGPKKDKILRKIKEKNLFRSVINRKILGVCGGLGEYFGIDPTLVRIIWLLVTLLTGVIFGIIVYIIFAFIMPEKAVQEEIKQENMINKKEVKDTEQ